MSSGRVQAAAAWTGSELLLFGGETAANALLAYDPKRNRWSSLPNAPLRERTAPAAVWTGRELIVWGGLRRLTNKSGQHTWPAWSPDDKRIAFVSRHRRKAAIYSMNADGSEQKRLTIERVDYAYPDWQQLRPAAGLNTP